MTVLPDHDAAQRMAASLDGHAGWSAFWDKRFGVWRVSEDDPARSCTRKTRMPTELAQFADDAAIITSKVTRTSLADLSGVG